MVGVELIRADGTPAVMETGRCIHLAAERRLLVTKCETNTIRLMPPLNLSLEDARVGVTLLPDSFACAFHEA